MKGTRGQSREWPVDGKIKKKVCGQRRQLLVVLAPLAVRNGEKVRLVKNNEPPDGITSAAGSPFGTTAQHPELI